MKTKHIFVPAALLFFLLVYTYQPLAAQGNSKKSRTQSEMEEKENDQKNDHKEHDKLQGNEKAKEDKDKVKDGKKDNDHEGNAKGKEKEFPGKGNAYGRDKDGLSGKDFGQRRAEEARGKAKENLDTSKVKMGNTQTTIQSSKDKITNAKTKIEADYKTGKMKPQVYEKAKVKLDSVEQKVRTLEKDAIKLKEKIENTTIEIKQP